MKYKLIAIREDLYNFLVKKTKSKESFDKTLRRLLKQGGGEK